MDETNHDVSTNDISKEDLINYMKIEHKYPEQSDPAFIKKIFEKVEFNTNIVPERTDIKTYDDVKEFRTNVCARNFALYPHQAFLSNFINPDTPYTGAVMFQGTGTGKTCGAIAVAEKFIPLVQKYGTKILILLSGPTIREMWKESILKCTGEKYMKYYDKTRPLSSSEKLRLVKASLGNALQYYQIMGYRGFYKKVLGEKIVERDIDEQDETKKKSKYRKNEEGEYERELSIDRIDSLNNTLIIVDEAHNLTNNSYGQALEKIIRNSHNLKILLLTATPMKNLGSDIVELINFLRPADSPMLREKIFTSDPGHLMKLKPDGIEYLKKMCRGYVSYLRGADPLIFAKRVDMGEIPNSLLFTKVTLCKLNEFQREVYDKSRHDSSQPDNLDSLDKRSTAVANLVIPSLSEDGKSIVGVYGPEGVLTLKKQLKIHDEKLNAKLKEFMKKLEPKQTIPNDLIYMNSSGKNVTGSFLKQPFLKHFSTKFDAALTNINKLVVGKLGPKTAFVYSNLVKVGIEIFKEVLLQNGWLEYQEQYGSYNITDDTTCYYCGFRLGDHKVQSKKSQEETVYVVNDLPAHAFRPATFLVMIGRSNDEVIDAIPEETHHILQNVFNNYENRNAKNIKLILGSRVMNEGINLENVEYVHILDVHYNLGRVDQVVGRAIRNCSHYKVITDKNRYPHVEVFKYCITLGTKELSSEEELYYKAELKHLLIKLIERALKEIAIDCPLNRNGNIFQSDLDEYMDCVHPTEAASGKVTCPAKCDYTNCNFVCDDQLLNNKYYDPKRNIYKTIPREKLDYTTFTSGLAKVEIDFCKGKIKDMYKLAFVYRLPEILNSVKQSYPEYKKKFFDPFYIYKALDELIPITENDFNNFKDTILDMYNRPGYLIYRSESYIFQPSNQNENVPMYYRTTYGKELYNKLNLYTHLQSLTSKTKHIDATLRNDSSYDFDSTKEYYNQKDENNIMGVIDKQVSSTDGDKGKDVFKIKVGRDKTSDKKRGFGIPSLKGAVCKTAKNKNYLFNIANKLNVKTDKNATVTSICDAIQEKLLDMEKYSIDGKTYMMIPKNHHEYEFPFNLKDRADYIIKQLMNVTKSNIDFDVRKIPIDKEKFKYEITFNDDDSLKNAKKILDKYAAVLKKNVWTITLL